MKPKTTFIESVAGHNTMLSSFVYGIYGAPHTLTPQFHPCLPIIYYTHCLCGWAVMPCILCCNMGPAREERGLEHRSGNTRITCKLRPAIKNISFPFSSDNLSPPFTVVSSNSSITCIYSCSHRTERQLPSVQVHTITYWLTFTTIHT